MVTGSSQKIVLAKQWKSFFEPELAKPYFIRLKHSLRLAYQNDVCYPPFEQIFRVFKLIDPHQVKVVIIGQDPYYRPHQADGLAFSMAIPLDHYRGVCIISSVSSSMI